MTAMKVLLTTVSAIAAIGLFGPRDVCAEPTKNGAASAQADTDRESKAHALIQSGIYAYKKRDYVAARYAFLEAYELGVMTSTGAMLADTEMKLQRYRDAAEHWKAYLEQLPVDQSRERADVTAQLAECRRHLGSIRPIVSPKGAHVVVDGTRADSKVTDGELWLDPGKYSVRAEVDDRASPSQDVALDAGDMREVALSVPSPPPPKPSASDEPPRPRIEIQAPPSPSPVSSRGTSARTVVVVGGSLLAVVAGAISAGYLIQSRLEYQDAENARADAVAQAAKAKIPWNGACSRVDAPSACLLLAEKTDDMNRSVQVGTYAAVTTGVIGVATVATWFLWPTAKSPQATASRLTVVPWAGPKDRGVVAQFVF